MPVNKSIREQVITENYIIFKHFLRFFTLSHRLKKSDILTKINILQLVYDNINISRTQKIENLQPFSFYTDGGSYNDDYYYFLHNIFQKTGVCHSTRVPKDANIQSYLGRKVAIDPTQMAPKNFKMKSSESNVIMIPYSQYIADKSEIESYK